MIGGGYRWSEIQEMTLAQVKVFSEACAQRKLAERSVFIHDLAVGFHAGQKDRMNFTDKLEIAGGRK